MSLKIYILLRLTAKNAGVHLRGKVPAMNRKEEVGRFMRVLVIESDPNLGLLWSRHIERLGAQVELVRSQSAAMDAIRRSAHDVLDGSIFAFMANACALIPLATRPEDMAALVEHHGRVPIVQDPPDHALLASHGQG